MKFSIISSAMLFAVSAGLASAHISIVSPTPRQNDQTMNSPIGTTNPALQSSIQPICKNSQAGPVQATWSAGETVPIQFGSHAAAHGGGHCQFSISYDGGKTFAVVHEELKTCFKTPGAIPPTQTNDAEVLCYNVPIPKDLPSGKAIFAWSWVNAIGNREFYMNCIDVEIKGGSSSSYTGKQMMIANHPWYTSTVIPEFNGNYDTGLDLYSAQPQISVGPGASSGAYSVSGPAPAPASSANAAGSGYSTTTSSGGNNSGAYSVSANSGSSAGGASYGAGAPAPGPVAISTDGNANYFAAPPPGQAYSSQQQGGSPAGYSSVDQNVYPRGRSAPAENAAISTPNQSSASGACSGSAFQCSADGGISVCVNGVQYSLACAPGTKCKTVSDGLPVCA